MKIISEIDIRNFDFWSGGADRAKDVKCDEDWDAIEAFLNEIYPDGMTDTQLNDIFWFDFDSLAEACGYENEEHYFYGAAKDEDEMFDVIHEHFPDANEDYITEWCENEWEKSDCEEKCLRAFDKWYYDQFARSCGDWVDRMYENSEGTVCQMKWFIEDKDLNEKTAEEWLEEFNQWLDDEADWIEEHEDEIFNAKYDY